MKATQLIQLKVKSCGCLVRDAIRQALTVHGYAGKKKSLTYRSWCLMRSRVKDVHKWKWYGAKNITVCARWDSFENFLADMGERPSRAHTLDRINPDGNYEPHNCRWATWHEQRMNRSRKGRA